MKKEAAVLEKFTFQVNEIEGPLDLILQLIARHKLNIYDIEISKLLEQYLLTIDEMREQDMEVASEFLEMAARLVHIKTVMLLPRHEEEETALKQQLTGQLLEYQACKQAAGLLAANNRMGDLFVREPMPLERDMTYRCIHSPGELFAAYAAAMGRGQKRMPPPVSAFSGIVSRRVVSVNARIMYLLKRFYHSPVLEFDSLFAESQERSELVATFLALLELVKGKRVAVSEDGKELFFLGRRMR